MPTADTKDGETAAKRGGGADWKSGDDNLVLTGIFGLRSGGIRTGLGDSGMA